MPNFQVRIERDYVVVEGFDRIVEAESQEAATAAARAMAAKSDRDCPDDCSETAGGHAEDFYVASVTPTTKPVDG